jgi:hypothetical protein
VRNAGNLRQPLSELTSFATVTEEHVDDFTEYVSDPAKIVAFERFARRWMELVDLHGGVHHGYFLPAEGASDKALALFTFPSLASYEQYRERFGSDPDFIAANRIRDQSSCVLRHERTFMRPLLPER